MSSEKSLSQKEIDALLAVLPADGSPLPGSSSVAPMARSYDFRSPDKFSKEQIRTLYMIHENFARDVGSSLTACLRTTVSVKCVHIEQGRFADFMQNVPKPSLISVLKMNPLPGRVLLSVDTNSATIAVDRLMGGAGKLPARERTMITEIEQVLLRDVLAYLIDDMRDAWKNIIELDIQLGDDSTLNPEFVHVALPSDAAIFLVFECVIRDYTGIMSLCIPYSVLKPIVSNLSPQTWIAGDNKEGEPSKEMLDGHLKRVMVEVTGLLGEASVSFNDLLHLQVGDILVLDSAINRPLPLLTGTNKKFLANPGLSGSKVAMQIVEVLEDISHE